MILVFSVAVTAFARMIRVIEFKTLVADSTLVFAGRVKSSKPSGIATSLTYPGWEGVTFEWLKVEVEVLEPIKGTKKGDVVRVAMLSIKAIKGFGIDDAPGTLEPTKNAAYLFCLVPTTQTNLYAAYTAPYDDNRAIFALNRNYSPYTSYREGKERMDSLDFEQHAVVWRLVDDAGKIMPRGAEWMRKFYATEITANSTNGVIHLEWETETNRAGWTRAVPKGLNSEQDSKK